MTRISRRSIERGLRAPAPAPGADLGRRIKDQIPDDLFAAPADASRTDQISGRPLATGARQPRAFGRSAAWAVAASLVVALGAGWLAVRLFETGGTLSPASVAVAPTAPEAEPAAAVDQLAPAHVSESAVEALVPARPDAAPAAAAASEVRERDQSPASPADRPVARAMESASDGPVAAEQALAKQATGTARVDGLVGEMFGTVADRSFLRSSSAKSTDATNSHAAGRLVLLVSATVLDVDATGNPAPAADVVELELDSALVSGHRLLASHAGDLDGAAPGAFTETVAARRVTALFEIEVAGDLDPTTVLGTVRLPATPAVAIRLGNLGAATALLPDHVSPETVASLRAELERRRASADIDEVAAQRANRAPRRPSSMTPPSSG